MISNKYAEKYEEEGCVEIYTDGGHQKGFAIWEGFFEFLMLACYEENFQSGGLVDAFCNHSGDESIWEIKNPNAALAELSHFDKNNVGTNYAEIVINTTNLKDDLIGLFREAIGKEDKLFVRWD